MSAALEIVGENVPVNVAVDISKAVDKAYSSILLSALSVPRILLLLLQTFLIHQH